MLDPMKLRRRQPWTLVIIPHRGTGSRSLTVRPWLRDLLRCGSLAALLLCVGVGWQAQGHGAIAGGVMQLASNDDTSMGWGSYLNLGLSSERPTVRQLRRRAAILHAFRTGLGSRRTAGKLLAGLTEPRWLQSAARGPQLQGTLNWPVPNGWYVRGYGSGEGGYHLAVDIMGERGTDVQAAAGGLVGYAGNAVKGYGNLVLLIHPGGWITAYAHNRKNLVVPGERVDRGQVIAELGNTGISRGPHVHFEFMHKGENCDPLPLFRPGVRHRAGHINPVSPLSWLPQQDRPRQVRCAPRRKHPGYGASGHKHASAGGLRDRVFASR